MSIINDILTRKCTPVSNVAENSALVSQLKYIFEVSMVRAISAKDVKKDLMLQSRE